MPVHPPTHDVALPQTPTFHPSCWSGGLPTWGLLTPGFRERFACSVCEPHTAARRFTQIMLSPQLSSRLTEWVLEMGRSYLSAQAWDSLWPLKLPLEPSFPGFSDLAVASRCSPYVYWLVTHDRPNESAACWVITCSLLSQHHGSNVKKNLVHACHPWLIVLCCNRPNIVALEAGDDTCSADTALGPPWLWVSWPWRLAVEKNNTGEKESLHCCPRGQLVAPVQVKLQMPPEPLMGYAKCFWVGIL